MTRVRVIDASSHPDSTLGVIEAPTLLQAKYVDEARKFWVSTFDGADISEEWHTRGISDELDRPKQSARTKSLQYKLELQFDQILTFCKSFNVTVLNFLQTIWAIVLRHYTRCDDVIYTCIISGQDEGDCARIIGTHVNTIPIRLALKDSMEVRELLLTVKDFYKTALLHSHVAITDVKRCTGHQWRRKRFSTLFSYQHLVLEESRMVGDGNPGFKSSMCCEFESTEYALGVEFVSDGSNSIFANILTRLDKIELGAVERMMAKFKDVLKKILDSPINNFLALHCLNQLSVPESLLIKDFCVGEKGKSHFDSLRKHGLSISVQEIFRSPSPARLASIVQENRDRSNRSQDNVVGDVPLTPIQHWFFESRIVYYNHFNQGWVLHPQVRIDFALFTQSISHIVEHHDMLRACYTRDECNEWRQLVHEPLSCKTNIHHIFCKSEEEFLERVKKMSSSFDIEKGSLYCAALFEIGHNQRIYFNIHHLVVDLVSWRILLEDLESLLKGGRLGEKTTSFQEWAVSQVQEAKNFDPTKWTRNISTNDMHDLTIRDGIEAKCINNRTISNKISNLASGQLDKANDAYRTNNQDLILTALLLSFQAITGNMNLELYLEGHGREPWNSLLDVSRTVGWFTTIYPVIFSSINSEDIADTILRVKETLRTVPEKGLSYGVIKYLAPITPDTKLIKNHEMTPIYFNYYGHFHNFEKNSTFFVCDERFMGDESDENEIYRALTIDSYFNVNGQLQLIFKFNSSIFHAGILESWGKKWTETMEILIDHCCSPLTHGRFSLHDFTLLKDPNLICEIETDHLSILNIAPREVEDIYPATPSQASFISALAQDPRAYVVQSVYEIVGNIELTRLKAAWNKVAYANTILRTAFVSTSEGIFQVVLKTPLDVFESMIEWSEVAVESLQSQFLASDRHHGFNLESTIFVRITIAHIMNSNRYRLFWTIHHSLIDGWSISLLLADFLNAYSKNEVEIRPPFKLHVDSILSTDSYEAKKYWTSLFDGAIVPEKLNILDDSISQATASSVIRSYDLKITTRVLQRYCNNIGVTPSNFLRAIWAIVQRHYMRCDDIIFGCVTLGRSETIDEVTRIIGALINTIPVRFVLHDSMTIYELLQAAQEFHVMSLPYSHISLTDIRSWTGLPWSREMFPTLFSYQNINSQQSTIDKLNLDFEMKVVEYYEATEYPLMLTIYSTEQSLSASAIINTTLIGCRAVDRLIAKYNEVLVAVLSAPADHLLTLGELDSLSSEDSSLIAKLSHGMQVPLIYPCLHHGFEHNAMVNPHVMAVKEPQSRNVTYGELDAHANSLANVLRDRGVIPGHTVGLVINRSIEMIVGILAILKAGGAYVPIDASLPKSRIDYMLKDSSCTIIATTLAASTSLQTQCDYETILIDDYMQAIPERASKPAELASSHDNAYVIYTSGTTGNPKGVPIHHEAAMNCIQALLDKGVSGPGVNQCQFTSVGFDVTVAEIFTCFTHGGSLILRSEEDFISSLKDVHSLMATPTGLQYIRPEVVPNLRVASLIGEPMSPALADIWLPHIKLNNTYGTTETGIKSSLQELKIGERIGIGRPFINTSYYVLDRNLKMVPMGVAGELFIAGASVAKGYINRPEVTAERFINNPFKKGTKMYKTGDNVRWSLDGILEFIGRTDDQVKVKGYRIELGEVAAAMNEYPGVELAVAVVRDNTLYGFVTPADVDVEDVRNSLFDFLPDYMVPATIVALEEFPMTANGKVDKSKLKEMSGQLEYEPEQPTTDRQRLVIKIMASVLNVDTSLINLHTSFFSLGGDSISAMALSAAFRRYGYTISVQEIFRSPTPAKLSVVAQERCDKPTHLVSAAGDLPITPMQKCFLGSKRVKHFNQKWILNQRDFIDFDDFYQAIASLVTHHDILRARFYMDDDGNWRQTIMESVEYEVNVRHISCGHDSEVREHVTRLTSRDFADDYVYCAILFETGSAQKVLFAAHCLVVDFFSWRVLLQDLDCLLRGRDLKEKTMPFREWAISMEHHTQSIEWREKDYVTELLDLNILTNNQRNGTDYRDGDKCFIINEVDANASALIEIANEAYKTDNHHLVLAALLTSFQEAIGQGLLPVIFEDSSRKHENKQFNLSRTVGQFATLHLTFLSMNYEEECGAVIKRIKETLHAIPDETPFSTTRAMTIENRLFTQDHHNVAIYFRPFEFSFDENEEIASPVFDKQYRICSSNESRVYNVITAEYSLNASKCLQLKMSFNPTLFQADTLASWGKKWEVSMQRIIDHCCSPSNPGAFSNIDFTFMKDPILLEEIVAEHLPTLGVKPRDVEDIYPATPLQTSFISRLLQDPGSYLLQSVYETERNIDIDRLVTAWTRVANVNTILRTIFISTRDGVFQIVLKNPPKAFEKMVEWTQADVDQQQEIFLVEDRCRGFSLDCLSFVRFTVARIKGTNRNRLLWTMHHSIMDGWSELIFFDDLFKDYLGDTVKIRPPFKAHIEAILSNNTTEAIEYWKSVFEGATVPNKLEVIGEMHRSRETDAHAVSFNLGVKAEQIQIFCQNLGVTVSHFLQAMWAVVIYHYTRCSDVIFGCVVSGRDLKVLDVTRMIGVLINTIPLRVVLNSSMTVKELLHAVQEFHVNSIPYSQTSLSDIRRWTGLPWTQEMFPTLLSYNDFNSTLLPTSSGYQEFKKFDIEQSGILEYSLSVVLNRSKNTIHSAVQYDATLFDAHVIAKIMSKYRTIVHETLNTNSADKLTVGDLNQLSEGESTLLLKFSIGTRSELPFECLHHGFEEMTRQFPENIAVEDDISLRQIYMAPTPAKLLCDSTSCNQLSISPSVIGHKPFAPKKIRILCLHGYSMNGEFMKLKMAALENELHPIVEFIYMDACFEINTPFDREWKSLYDGLFFSWIPPEQPDRKHVEQSIHHVLSFLNSLETKIDGLLGFSQGSCIIELLDRMAEYGEIERQWNFTIHLSGVLMDFKLVSNDYSRVNLLQSISIPSLHCMSPQDSLYGNSLKVCERYNPELRLTLEHSYGHVIPKTTDTITALSRLILEARAHEERSWVVSAPSEPKSGFIHAHGCLRN
ncbi:uncharacterized protein VTP21DRAFT_8115 [Calcarisporiella thermophila]|uniref:uncharacterized protein n=1 Tax=Calcarisporiella thermophila TaxID=911321 RepID=UPI0037440AC3